MNADFRARRCKAGTKPGGKSAFYTSCSNTVGDVTPAESRGGVQKDSLWGWGQGQKLQAVTECSAKAECRKSFGCRSCRCCERARLMLSRRECRKPPTTGGGCQSFATASLRCVTSQASRGGFRVWLRARGSRGSVRSIRAPCHAAVALHGMICEVGHAVRFVSSEQFLHHLRET